MTTILLPALITVFYRSFGAHSALQICNTSAAPLHVTIIHDGIHELSSYERAGERAHQSIDLTVQDHEALIVLVRNASEVVASGIFEVSLAQTPVNGEILIPRSVHNLSVVQGEAEMQQRALSQALTSTAFIIDAEAAR